MLVKYPQSLKTMHDASYQAYLIDEGINVLKALQNNTQDSKQESIIVSRMMRGLISFLVLME